MPLSARSTVDAEEIARFTAMADEWWDVHGKFKPLHAINPLRVGYIAEMAAKHFGGANAPSGLSILDIGCGGGLVCEPLARLGARVTGIDAGEKNIAVAKLHAEKMGLDVAYRCASAEEMQGQYDVVLALEIIEHVADVDAFVSASAKLLKPGGLMIYSTMNRTTQSFALAIVGAEYVLRWLPRGTHDWKKFLKPSELCKHLRAHGIDIIEMTGMVMSPFNWKWRLDAKDLSVNYLVVGKKN